MVFKTAKFVAKNFSLQRDAIIKMVTVTQTEKLEKVVVLSWDC